HVSLHSSPLLRHLPPPPTRRSSDLASRPPRHRTAPHPAGLGFARRAHTSASLHRAGMEAPRVGLLVIARRRTLRVWASPAVLIPRPPCTALAWKLRESASLSSHGAEPSGSGLRPP